MSFYRKGNSGGIVRISIPNVPDKECRPDCFMTLDFPSDTGKATIRPFPDPGTVFAGWDNCPEISADGACLVDVGDVLNTDVLCVTFILPGSVTPGPGCPPSSPQPPPPPPDTTPPNTRIRSGPSRPTRNRRATFRFASTEARSHFICKLDRRDWRSCVSPKSYRNLKPGIHTFRVRAIDVVGNIDPTPAVRRWRVRR